MNDLVKQYISQTISLASNNLRLTSEKIEVVALLRETIFNSSDLDRDIQKMKKITRMSTLGIKLAEIFAYLNNSKIDFTKINEKIKEHSNLLVKDLNLFLENINPKEYKNLVGQLYSSSDTKEIIVELPQSESKISNPNSVMERIAAEKRKEEIILEDDNKNNEDLFVNFEETVLKLIKPLDQFLRDLSNRLVTDDDIMGYAKILKKHGDLSEKYGTPLISSMHRIFAKALVLIRNNSLQPDREVIEALRSCLIVIVALVKNKEVDVTIYLNRAEDFGRRIQTMKLKD